jgi:hypothetical protein
MFWIGIFLVIVSIASLIFGLYVSFTSEGGSIGQIPVLAYAVAFPVLLTMALGYLRMAGQLGAELPGWILWVAFPGLVFLSGFLIIKAGNMGKRRHQRRK